jgi:hypothetical protein
MQELAWQYLASLLADWIVRLKNQAELFDIKNLAKTLNGFHDLIVILKRTYSSSV